MQAIPTSRRARALYRARDFLAGVGFLALLIAVFIFSGYIWEKFQ